MITSLELKIDVKEDLLGICVEKKDPAPKFGETLEIYIPSLMPKITKSIPTKKTPVSNKGAGLFLNDPSCRPPSKTLLTTQNFLTGTLERNSEWKREENSRIETRDLEDIVKEDGSRIKYEAKCELDGSPVNIKFIEEYKVYYTVGEERINCYMPSGKFSKLLFDDSTYLD